MQFKETHDTDHGRIETRASYYLVDDFSPLPDIDQWPGMAAIGMVVATRTDQTSGQSSTSVVFIYTAHTRSRVSAHATRTYWGVENSLHRVLDMVYREDKHRIRSGASAAFMNHLRQIANNLLSRLPSTVTSASGSSFRAYDHYSGARHWTNAGEAAQGIRLITYPINTSNPA